MKIIHWILLVVIVGLSWLVYMARKYGNPYKLYMVFGKKGSGKTTLLVKLARLHLKKGWTVYSTCPVPGAYLISPNDIGKFEFASRSAVFVDEVGMVWDNRDFKNFDTAVRDWFKLQRQRKLKVYLFSQTFDVDLKIRNLCDKMYMCMCFGGWLSYAKEIKRRLVVVKPSENAESRIADELVISPFFLFPFGARILTYIPHWIPYFKTDYMAKPLLRKEWQLVPDVVIEKHSLWWYLKHTDWTGEVRKWKESMREQSKLLRKKKKR